MSKACVRLVVFVLKMPCVCRKVLPKSCPMLQASPFPLKTIQLQVLVSPSSKYGRSSVCLSWFCLNAYLPPASSENLSNLVFPGLSGKRYVGDYIFFPPVNDINVILILLQRCINIILILHWYSWYRSYLLQITQFETIKNH